MYRNLHTQTPKCETIYTSKSFVQHGTNGIAGRSVVGAVPHSTENFALYRRPLCWRVSTSIIDHSMPATAHTRNTTQLALAIL